MNVSFEYFGNRNLQTSIKDFRYGSFEIWMITALIQTLFKSVEKQF